MFTVALRNADTQLPLIAVDDYDQELLFDQVAALAAAGPVTAGDAGHVQAILAATLGPVMVLALAESSAVFDRWTVWDGDVALDLPFPTVPVAQDGLATFRTYVRDDVGRFAPTGAGETLDPGAPAMKADIVVDGGRVKVRPDAAVAMIEDLGQRPDPSDLTKVSIIGHPNLFGSVARNQLPRHHMPQIPSDRLDDFAGYLHQRGITTRTASYDPAELSATQNELDGRKVGSMIRAMRLGTMPPGEKPLWISSDMKLLDGHHRWAAEAVLSVGEAPRKVKVVQVSVPMTSLIAMARGFNLQEAITAKRHGMTLTWFTHEGAIKAWQSRDHGHHGPHPVITAAEARGDSRPVSYDEFQRLASLGRSKLDAMAEGSSPPSGLDEHWDQIKRHALGEARKPWGGATIDAHTGQPLAQGANVYALTVKDQGAATVSIPEGASDAEFSAAMDRARQAFGPVLARQSHYLGVFHDDDNRRIDIDPVTIVESIDDVETIGAATHAIGGAYNFADGNGYWPPHVKG